MILVGTQTETSRAGIVLAEQHADMWATVGYHPNHVAENWHHDKKEQRLADQPKFDINGLRELAKHKKVVAVGECGLDYYRLQDNESKIKERQQDIFLQQVKLAKEFNKALMIHCRPSKGTDDAYEDVLKLLVPELAKDLTKVVHFYVGSPTITEKLLDAGFYFTFGGVITFARDYDKSIACIPLDRILLETDAPYVAPEPYRGKRNEPAYIVSTAKKMAELKGVSFEELAHITTKNAQTVFKIS